MSLATLHSLAPLSPADARALTDRIRSTAEQFAGLLREAYERRAWEALGYSSWREYATTELSISQSRAYQLLDHAKVIAAVQEAAGGISTMVEIGERDARRLKPHLEEVTEEIRERVESGEEPKAAVAAVVDTKREERQAERREKEVARPEPAPETAQDDEVAEWGEAPQMDVHAELAHALEENQRLREALDATDQGAELRRWTEKYARLDGRVQQMLTTEAELKKTIRYLQGTLKKVAGVLRVERFEEIVPRLTEVVQ